MMKPVRIESASDLEMPEVAQHRQSTRLGGVPKLAAWDARPRAWAAPRVLEAHLSRSDPRDSSWCGRQRVLKSFILPPLTLQALQITGDMPSDAEDDEASHRADETEPSPTKLQRGLQAVQAAASKTTMPGAIHPSNPAPEPEPEPGPEPKPKPKPNPNPDLRPKPNPNPNQGGRCRKYNDLEEKEVQQHGQSAAPLAGPQLGSCASPGRAWRLWLARHTPMDRPAHWVPSHCLGCSSQPPPKPPISPPLTT